MAVSVLWLLIMVLWAGLQYVIVVFLFSQAGKVCKNKKVPDQTAPGQGLLVRFLQNNDRSIDNKDELVHIRPRKSALQVEGSTLDASTRCHWRLC